VPSRGVSFKEVYRAASPGPGARLPEGWTPARRKVSTGSTTVTWGFGVSERWSTSPRDRGRRRQGRFGDASRLRPGHQPLIVGARSRVAWSRASVPLSTSMSSTTSPASPSHHLPRLPLPTSARCRDRPGAPPGTPSDRNPLGVKGVASPGQSPRRRRSPTHNRRLISLKVSSTSCRSRPATVAAAIERAGG